MPFNEASTSPGAIRGALSRPLREKGHRPALRRCRRKVLMAASASSLFVLVRTARCAHHALRSVSFALPPLWLPLAREQRRVGRAVVRALTLAAARSGRCRLRLLHRARFGAAEAAAVLEVAAIFKLAPEQAPSSVAQQFLALAASLRPLAFGHR